jgi:predicted ArsR family transcriptional regulator
MLRRARSDRIASVAALDDPMRRALFDFVCGHGSAVSRDVAADALHISRRVAALHLDKLTEQGLLLVEYRRLHGRTGPGAGRPAKLYRRSDNTVSVSVPERRDDLVGELFVTAVAESIKTGTPVAEILNRTAFEAGRAMGAATGDVFTALAEAGYEPFHPEEDRGLALRNCPFHRLAQQYTDLMCGLNLQLLRGLTEGAGDTSYTLVLDPGSDRCCVRLAPVGG